MSIFYFRKPILIGSQEPAFRYKSAIVS